MKLKRHDSLPIVGDGARECGGCTACCTTMVVQELGKPEFTPCDKLLVEQWRGAPKEMGCSIYDDRPESCRVWSCLWIGGMPARWRPDKCGLVFVPPYDLNKSGMTVVGAMEIKPSASRMPAGEKAIKWLTKRRVGVLVRLEGGRAYSLGGRALYPPRGQRDKAAAVLKSRGVTFSWNGRFFSVGGGHE